MMQKKSYGRQLLAKYVCEAVFIEHMRLRSYLHWRKRMGQEVLPSLAAHPCNELSLESSSTCYYVECYQFNC